MYPCILVSTDFSKSAGQALDHAMALARKEGSRLVLLYAAEPILSHYGVVGLIPAVKEWEQQHDIDSRLKLKELAAQGRETGLTIDCRVVAGAPWEAVVQVAEEVGANLIVMGSHGHAGFSHERVGSTVARVLARAACPVLVVGSRD